MGQVSSPASKDEDNGDLESSFTNYFEKIKTENKIISQEHIQLIESHLKKGNIQVASSVINDALKNIGNTPINIAVIGESGTGKSSFINALRGVGPEDEGAADVGVVETTIERIPYKHPQNKMLILWDLPGIRTMNFSMEDYMEKVKFQEYDFFIIVSSTRFTKLDLDLAKAIRSMNKNYYFVRTKVDLDLDNEKKYKPRTFDREKTLQQIRSIYVNAFSWNNMDVPQIFLISNSNLSDYDFPCLMDTLVKDLPAQKRHNFMHSLANITEAAIDKNHKFLWQIILLDALKTGLLGTVPVVGILKGEVEELKEKLNLYRVLFGVDDASLQVIAKDSQVPAEQLKKIIKSPYLLDTEKRETLEAKLLKYLERFASVNGGLLAKGLYFRKTFYLEFLFLDTVTEDAKVVLRETYSKISSNSCQPQLLTMDKKQRWVPSEETGAQWSVVPVAELQRAYPLDTGQSGYILNTAMGQVSSPASKDEDNGDLESSFTNYFKKIKTENKIISQEYIHLIESHLEKGNIQVASSVINDALKNIGNTPINIAVIGESGTGKSSFINALRGVGPEDEGAADVGVVLTTIERTPYKHPQNKMLILWDLPGIRTMNFPMEDYLEKVKFQEYDFFIIVSSTRFTKLDLDLAKAIRFMKKNYYFVRTKVDLDLDNEKKYKPHTFDREMTLQQIRSTYVNAFSWNNMDVPQIFLISNSNLSDYDFPCLMDTLIKDLPAQKRHNFMLSLGNITEAAFNKKHKSMQQTILSEAKKTYCFATILQ
ncbi:hypothetical protein ACRRTK_020813 [Alexandromys fortis]